jgi:hypothetical protein
MHTRTKNAWATVTLLVIMTGAANAQEPAMVRLSDSPPNDATSSPAPGAETGAIPGALGSAATGPDGAANDPDCDDGGGFGCCHLCHGCLSDGRLAAYLAGSAVGEVLAGDRRCCLSYHPMQGFRKPVSTPIQRDAMVYYHYWPAKWYGEPGWNLTPRFPMVYTPTDTTQLGFYYSRVPTWAPNPAMYPTMPRPSDWHRRQSILNARGANGALGAAGECGPVASSAVIPPQPSVGPSTPVAGVTANAASTVPPAPASTP